MDKTYDEIIPEFLGDDDLRKALMKPVLIGDYVYASNGHIAIKIPVSKLSKTYELNPDYPNIISLYEKREGLFQSPIVYKIEDIFSLLQQISLIDIETECKVCDGLGDIPVENSPGDVKDCKECKGTGFKSTGKKEYDWQNHKIQIGLAYFNPNYVHKFLCVAGINGIKEIKHICGTPINQHLFIIDDLEIIIMPIRMNSNELSGYSVHKLNIDKEMDI